MLDISAKRFVIFAVCVFIVLSIFIFYMGYSENKEMEETVAAQFNRQQLIIAKKIAQNINNHFRFLRIDINEINRTISKDITNRDVLIQKISQRLERLKDWDVIAIVYIDSDSKVSFVTNGSLVFEGEDLGFDYSPYWQWGNRAENRGKINIGRTFKVESGPLRGRWIAILTSPIYNPVAIKNPNTKYKFEGVVFLIVDPISIAKKYTMDVRSGETGYSWVIDEKGTILAHYERTFVGQDTFTVRSDKDPELSYQKLNDIIKEQMLKGQDGMDWYISGWHRGKVGETKKLFAYAPVFLGNKDDKTSLWSIGVAAPLEEVYGIIRSVVTRQWAIAGAFQLVMFTFLALAVFFSLRWSGILQREVDKKTADLIESEGATRLERDKVKQSMETLLMTQDKLIRSERMAAIGEAAARLSHEIKNPLVTIGGFAAQVERTLPKDDNNVKKLNIIKGEIKRLETLLEDVGDFIKPLKPQKRLEQINKLINETYELMSQELENSNIKIEKKLDEGLSPLLIDPQQIKQVFINLIKNAYEAMPDDGTISITSKDEGAHVSISITDTGQGISPETAVKVFEPFNTNKKQGTGLGLSVCLKIVEDHGGTIIVESKEGEGSTFTVQLPVLT
jgi:signal transduction histidine kinase